MIRVVVVDDQELVRSAFVALLHASPGVEVVGQAGDGASAVELVLRTRPDVVLMDIRMPHLDGLDATRRILAHPNGIGTRVLVLTTFDDDDLVLRAIRAGASGFLLKDARPRDLLEAVEVIANGDALLAPKVTRRLIERLAGLPVEADAAPAGAASTTHQDGIPTPSGGTLTDREREVLLAVAQGLSNQEIAEHLHLGYGTVKTHVSHLLTKLGSRDRAQLVVYAYDSGMTTPGR